MGSLVISGSNDCREDRLGAYFSYLELAEWEWAESLEMGLYTRAKGGGIVSNSQIISIAH